MRIGDIFVILSEPKEMRDKYLGIYYNVLVKPIRADFTKSVNVSIFVEHGTTPEKQTFEKGKATKIKDMNPNAVFRVADIDIAGLMYEGKPRTFIRIYAVPNKNNFLFKYIEKSLALDDAKFAEGMGWKNFDENGDMTIRPFIFWKFVKYIYNNKHAMPAWKEAAVLEDIVEDNLKEIEALEKANKRLADQALIAGGINPFTKSGKLKKKYLKDLEGV